MSTLVVIQARTGSSRFPRKVLAELAGQTMLGFMLDRIAPLAGDAGTTLAVATSDRTADDEVATIARSKQVAAVRGSEADVLDRFRLALDHHPADNVVRLTADCPLMDPEVVRSVLALHRTSGADYTSNTLARTFPDGLDVEVMTADALRAASTDALAPDEREHVTPHVQRFPRRFQLAQLVAEEGAADERWTVDNPTDLASIRLAIELAEDPIAVGWKDLLALVGRSQPDITTTPIEEVPHRRGSPYHRRWEVRDVAGAAGSGLVVVDDGGWGTLAIEGPRPGTVDAAIRRVLQADLQVTRLDPPVGSHPA